MAEFDHVVLTPEQEAFLERFLDYKARKPEKAAEENRQKRSDYRAFVGTQGAVEAVCTRLAAAGVDVASIRARLNSIAGVLEQGKSKLTLNEALQRASEVLHDAEDLQHRMEQKQAILSQLMWIGTPPPGANVAEAKQLAQICKAVQTSLAAQPPDSKQLLATQQALSDAVRNRATIVEACAQRRRELAAVGLAMDELRKRQDDAKARLALLAKAPDGAAKLAAQIENVLQEMAGALKLQTAEGIAEAKARHVEAFQALPGLEKLLAAAFEARVSQAIDQAGAQPVAVALTKLAGRDPAAFGSAVSVLAQLREKAGGDIDDLALAQLETNRRNRARGLEMSRAEVRRITEEIVRRAGNEPQQGGPRQRGNRAGLGARGIEALLKPVEGEDPALAALKVDLERASLDVERRARDVKLAEEKSEAGQAVAALMEALRHGPLSSGHGREVKGPAAKQIIELFARNPGIARECLSAATTAEHPESVARCGTIVCDALQANANAFAGLPLTSPPDYAKALVAASATCDAATIETLPAYLQSGRMRSKLDLGGGEPDPEARRKARTGHVRAAVLRPDGSLDVAAGREALMDVTFHPDALSKPSPVLAAHMRGTLAFFEKTPQAQAELAKVQDPRPGSAGASLVARSAGATGVPNRQDARTAVLNAMLTPVYQGAVGSCFATSGVIGMRQTQPMEALRTLTGLASEGVYRPRQGDPVPAVDNPNVEGDPLIRSLEYSAATAVAKSERSKKREILLQRNADAILEGLPPSIVRGEAKMGVSGMPVAGEPDKRLVSRLAAAVSKAVEFDYDPARGTPVGADGQSETGVYVMRSAKTGAVITPDLAAIEARVRKEFAHLGADELAEAVKLAREQAESEAGNAYWENVGPIIAEILRDEGKDFDGRAQASTKMFFLKAAKAGGATPWQPTSGGQTSEAAAVILGAQGQQTELTPEVDPGAVGSVRALEVMRATMQNFQRRRDQGEEMAVMRTVGQHGFNGLPTHPSLAPLLDSGLDLQASIDKHIVRKGKELQGAPLTQGRLEAIFRKDAEELAGDNPKMLEELLKNPPDTDMTPAQYQSFLGLAVRMATGGGFGVPTEAERDRVQQAEAMVRRRMIQELDVPQYVIADSNWGDTGKRLVFVMLPDPITGNLEFLVRVDPEGTLREPPGGAKAWLCKSWAVIT